MICDYGCKQEAKFQFKNGKWCCSESWNSCPEKRRKNREVHLGRFKGVYRKPKSQLLLERNNLCSFGCGEKAKYQFKNGKYCCNERVEKCKFQRKLISSRNKDQVPWNKNRKNIYSKEHLEFLRFRQLGYKFSKESRIKMGNSQKENFKDPEFCKEYSKRFFIRPNKPENLVLEVLDRRYPNEWKYTGDYSFWINGKNPDFTCTNGKKLLIEHFGTYWHKDSNPEERKKIFAEFGYKTLVIWEDELKDMKKVENRIRKFVEKTDSKVILRRRNNEETGFSNK